MIHGSVVYILDRMRNARAGMNDYPKGGTFSRDECISTMFDLGLRSRILYSIPTFNHKFLRKSSNWQEISKYSKKERSARSARTEQSDRMGSAALSNNHLGCVL